ncbi:MAG TPA: hypothetical protein VNZ22_15620 [Bacillota bacterium]|nr:hypothetical protein [Bacillota bacterium]
MLLRTWQALVALWEEVFAQARTHRRAVGLALGLMCGVGRRTVTRALGFWGKDQQDWSADYKVFSRSPWEAAALFAPLLHQAVEAYCPADQPVVAAVDDTVVGCTGKKIPQTAWQRDPRSPPFQANLIWGHRFMQASLTLPLYRLDPESSPRALPVRFAECPAVRKPRKTAPPEQWEHYRRARKECNRSTQFVAVGQEVRRRLDVQGFAARWLLLTGDNSYCNRTTFGAKWERTHLVCRARKNYRLCFRHKGPGQRFYGQRKFTPEQVYHDQRRKWQPLRVFHGGAWRQVRYKEVTSVLWPGGTKRQYLRLVVLAPTPYRKTKTGRTYYRERAFLLTDDLATPAQVLVQAYLDHFEIEFNHRDEKSILGVGQAQVWSPKSVPRVPELVVAAYSGLLLASLQAYGPKRTADYDRLPKWRRHARRPSCQDLVQLLRQELDEWARAAPTSRLPGFEQMMRRAAA